MEDFKTRLSEHYNKFNEDKRLTRRHGQVEFNTSMNYLLKYLQQGDTVVDIGAGSGRYCMALKEKGYEVTAVELCRPNIGKIKRNDPSIKVIEASATDLSIFEDDQFDVSIVFGPMYHLYSKSEKLKALLEAKRITKKYIFVCYLMNDYALIQHAFIDNNYKDIKEKLDKNYHIDDKDNLYFQSRIEDMDELNKEAHLHLVCRFAPDGPSDYIRSVINKMDEETFEAFKDYQMKNAERKELLGASSHVVDVLTKHFG